MVFGQVEFKTAGTYFVEVLVDDVMKFRYPVPVILRAAAKSTKSAAAAAARRKKRPDFPATRGGGQICREALRSLPDLIWALTERALSRQRCHRFQAY